MSDPFAGLGTPRRWQAECFPLAWEAIRAKERTVIHACTGAGKTVLQLAIVRKVTETLKPGWRVLVIVPRQALVVQTAAEFGRVLGVGAVGVYYGKRRQPDRSVVIACQDSLDRLADAWALSGARVALAMVDECHRANTEAIRAVIDNRLQPVTRIGLTATPFLSCEADALIGWDRLVYRYTIEQAIKDGVLVPMKLVVWRGDPNTTALEKLIAMINESAPPGPGLVSAQNKKEAAYTADAMTAAGITAESIDSSMSDATRKAKIGRLLRGDVRCLVHVDLLTEGVDIPSLRWLGMLRDRESAVAITQEAGRPLRTLREPDRWGEKTEAVFLLPHATSVVDSIGRDPRLSPTEIARALEEAAARELAPRQQGTHLAPLGVTWGDVDGWVAGLLAAVRAAGVAVETMDGPWRGYAPSSGRLALLRDLVDAGVKSPLRYLPAGAREEIRRYVAQPECLSGGSVSDLCSILIGLRAKAAAHIRANADRPDRDRYWRGVRDGIPVAPSEVAA